MRVVLALKNGCIGAQVLALYFFREAESLEVPITSHFAKDRTNSWLGPIGKADSLPIPRGNTTPIVSGNVWSRVCGLSEIHEVGIVRQ